MNILNFSLKNSIVLCTFIYLSFFFSLPLDFSSILSALCLQFFLLFFFIVFFFYHTFEHLIFFFFFLLRKKKIVYFFVYTHQLFCAFRANDTLCALLFWLFLYMIVSCVAHIFIYRISCFTPHTLHLIFSNVIYVSEMIEPFSILLFYFIQVCLTFFF